MLLAGLFALGAILLFLLAPRYHELRAKRLLRLGRDRQAARHLDRALRLRLYKRGVPTLAAARAQAILARIRFIQGLADRGEALLESARQTALARVAEKPSRDLLATLLEVGRASIAAERYEDSVFLAERAGVIAAASLNVSDPLEGAIDALFAEAYTGLGQFEQAHEHYQHALESYRLSRGESSPEFGAVLASMAASLARQERWREAREAGLEAIEILDGADSTRLPEALNALAELDTRRGKLAEAEGLRLSICHLWERLGGSDCAALAREYELRAELLRSMQRMSEAGYLLCKAREIRQTAVAGA